MATKPMHKFLNATLTTCLHEGTSVRESGLVVSARKDLDEIILFFHLDCEDGRKSLNMLSQGLCICDYLIFYAKKREAREVVCFLELKAGKEKEAFKQIISAYNYLKNLPEYKKEFKDSSKAAQEIVWKACICFHGQSPRVDMHARNELAKIFKNNISIKHGTKHYKLLGDFLRE